MRDGDSNVMIGSEVGNNTAVDGFSGNVRIGYGAGNTTTAGTQGDNRFFLGNATVPDWLYGEITSTGNLYVNGQEVVTTSSRKLKKNIQRVEDLSPYLEDLLEIPLFTYQYKSKDDYPEKVRMGVISEELAPHLQIKKGKFLPFPDWPTIYGTLWASIKELHRRLELFKAQALLKLQTFANEVREFKEQEAFVFQNWTQVQEELLDMSQRLKEVNKEIEVVEKEIVEVKRFLQSQRQGRSRSQGHKAMGNE